MTPTPKYKKFLSELIRRHMTILGPNISRDVALQVNGLTIEPHGDVSAIEGDPSLVVQDLVNRYGKLSAPVTQLLLYQLLEHYPDIKAEYNQPLTRVKLVCALTQKDGV